MTEDADAPLITEWEGKYVSVKRRGRWEYASRTGSTNAVVIIAETEGKLILVEQFRVPVGKRCLELPAGLVGDEDPNATVEETAVKELEEETGFTAASIERLGDFHSSPGMLAESFALVRAHGVERCGEGGGNEQEDIPVHLVAREDIRRLVADRRAAGTAIDAKLLLFLAY